jgi:hypothetical protein
MTRTDDLDYYTRRLEQARAQALTAAQPEARRVYRELAERYDALTAKLSRAAVR